jgi:hypothetical protein
VKAIPGFEPISYTWEFILKRILTSIREINKIQGR